MAAIAKIYIPQEQLKQMLADSNGKGLSINVKIVDKLTESGKNVFMSRTKTKTEIDEKANDVTYAFGHCVYSKGECLENKQVYDEETKTWKPKNTIVNPEQQINPTEPIAEAENTDDLPF